jgi:D-glycero-D-manno-heptose 1,7-bisphosphate phosphatase
VFLDRDGTLIEEVPYLSDPARLRLLPGAAEAVRRLQQAGFACVVISNQSALARGLITEDQLERIHAELHRQLAQDDVTLDAIYYCPDAPGGADRTIVESWDRKPGPGLLFRAAADLGLDLQTSWMVGDMISDLLAGRHVDCRGSILVRTGKGLSESEARLACEHQIADDLRAAAELILQKDKEA